MYQDPDVASAALRNLKKYEILGRQLKVDFASDNKNGNNLKKEDVLFRDSAEVVKTHSVQNAGQQTSSLTSEPLNPQTTTTDEMLENFSMEQQEAFLLTLKELSKYLC